MGQNKGAYARALPLGANMSKLVKTVVVTLVVAFLIYYLYTRPEEAAAFVRGIFRIFDSVGRFFDGLVR